MAITTLDAALAGMQPPIPILKVGTVAQAAGILRSLWYDTGNPGAGAAPGASLAGAVLTATTSGQLPFTNPVSGNTYLARLGVESSVTPGVLYLCDRLWTNGAIVISTTTAQTVTSPTWPARSGDGTTNGAAVMVGIEVNTATTNGSPITNTTMSYTNQAGTAGQVATIASFPANAVKATFIPFQLAAGDTGVRAIASITLGTSYVTGTINMCAYRVLARIDLPIAAVGNAIDLVTGGFVQLYNSSVPFMLHMPTATTATNISGELIYTQG